MNAELLTLAEIFTIYKFTTLNLRNQHFAKTFVGLLYFSSCNYIRSYIYLVLHQWRILSISLLICLFMIFLYQEGVAGTSAKFYLAVLLYTESAINGPQRLSHT